MAETTLILSLLCLFVGAQGDAHFKGGGYAPAGGYGGGVPAFVPSHGSLGGGGYGGKAPVVHGGKGGGIIAVPHGYPPPLVVHKKAVAPKPCYPETKHVTYYETKEIQVPIFETAVQTQIVPTTIYQTVPTVEVLYNTNFLTTTVVDVRTQLRTSVNLQTAYSTQLSRQVVPQVTTQVVLRTSYQPFTQQSEVVRTRPTPVGVTTTAFLTSDTLVSQVVLQTTTVTQIATVFNDQVVTRTAVDTQVHYVTSTRVVPRVVEQTQVITRNVPNYVTTTLYQTVTRNVVETRHQPQLVYVTRTAVQTQHVTRSQISQVPHRVQETEYRENVVPRYVTVTATETVSGGPSCGAPAPEYGAPLPGPGVRLPLSTPAGLYGAPN